MLGRVGGFFRSMREFNQSFWSANVSELFERVAFYGMTAMLVIYLHDVRGVSESAAIALNGNFGLVVYSLPVLSGVIADWLGYRKGFLLAYVCLGVGYLLVGQFTTYWTIAGALLLVAFGASIVKPAVTGTVQKTCLSAQAAVGFSIYYMLVNIGGFLGPNVSGLVSNTMGLGVERVFYASAVAIGIAILIIVFLFKEPAEEENEAKERMTFSVFVRNFFTVISNGQMMFLFLWVTLYWSIFFQFFGAFPLYLTNDLGVTEQGAAFIISLDAAAIVCLQVVVGYVVRNLITIRAILFGFIISSIGVMAMAIYPAAWVAAVGILIWSIGEMFYAAHFYKYMGDMAPKDQVGMYMGFAFLPVALGSFLSGIIGGPVSSFARDTLGLPQLMWLIFGGIGIISVVGLALQAFVFKPKTA